MLDNVEALAWEWSGFNCFWYDKDYDYSDDLLTFERIDLIVN